MRNITMITTHIFTENNRILKQNKTKQNNIYILFSQHSIKNATYSS